MPAFRADLAIRFRHCDPAGIVFYPRYVELLNDLVEDWFAAMDAPFEGLISQGMAVPMAALEAQFDRPSRQGETLTAWLAVERVGRSSCRINVELVGPDGERRVMFRATMVFADMTEVRSEPWPIALREAMLGYTGEETAA